MRFTYILTSLVFYISLSAAWPWPANLFIRDASGSLAIRQDNNNDDKPASSSAQPASTAASESAKQTDAPSSTDDSKSSAPSSTDKPSSDDSNNKGNSTSSAKESSSVSITQAEAGGVSMMSPSTSTTTYFKYGDNITFVWNYTSLAVTPTAVDVLVSIQSLGATYTIASNMSVNATGSAVWNTGNEKTANPPPGTDKYTLAIYDAGNAAGPTQTSGPGILGVWDQFTFGMYTPQPYVAQDEGEWK